MGIFRDIAAALWPKQQPATTEATAKTAPANDAEKGAFDIGNGFGIRHHGMYWQDSPIERLLNEASGLTPGVDPRHVLGACRALNAILPVYTAAQMGFVSLLGSPKVITQDEKFKEAVEKLIWPEIRLHGEKIDYMTETKGIEHVARAMLDTAFKDGMGFYICLDADQQIASNPRQKVTGIRICDSIRWEAQEFRPDYVTWQYTREGMIYEIRRDKIAGSLNLPDRRMPEGVWNRQMAYEGLFMSEILLKALKARGRKHTRDGSPATITTISSEYPKDADQDTINSNREAMNVSLTPIKAAFKEAIQHTNDTGRPVDLVVTHGGPLNIDSHTYGEGQTWLTGFENEIREYIRWIAVGTGFPIYRLVPTEGGGLNADNAKSQDDAAVQISVQIHQPSVAAEIDCITRTICERAGIRIPADFKVEFEGGNFDNPKTTAEIAKIQAEATKILVETFDMIFMGSGMDAAMAFAEEMDLEFMEKAKPVVPPMPEPGF